MADARGSWYSQYPEAGWIDREDRPGSNALGVPDNQQGIALPSRKTLGQWFDVKAPNGQTYRLQQTDIGPSARTGRGIDISAAAGHRMGYSPETFPTDGMFSFNPSDGGSLPPSAKPTSGAKMPDDMMLSRMPQQGGNPLMAGLLSFLGGGNLPQAIGGGIGGLMSGQRQDPDYLDRQENAAKLQELRRQHGISEARGTRANDLAERRLNQPSLTWKKDPDTEEMIPYLFNPGDQSLKRVHPSLAGPPPAGEDESIPTAAGPVQYITPGAPGMPATGTAPPVGLNPKQMRIYNETRARAQATQDVKKQSTAKGDSDQNRIVVEDLDRAIKYATENPWTSTGFVGGGTKDIPGTPGHNLSELVSSAESGVSLERLQKLRQESPTGGALGNVSDKDMNILKAALGSLKNSQSKDQFIFNAQRVKKIYQEIIHGPAANAVPPAGRGPQRPPLGSFNIQQRDPNAL